MEKVKAGDTGFDLVIFSQQVLDKAITARLSFAQREYDNYPALEVELPNLWEVAQKSYQRKAWKVVLAFQDALRPFLDQRGYWSRSLVLNGWATEAAQALGRRPGVQRAQHARGDPASHARGRAARQHRARDHRGRRRQRRRHTRRAQAAR